MRKHKITLGVISNCEFEMEIAGIHGEYGNKAINMICNTTDPINRFSVVSNHKTVAIFTDIEKAIAHYNAI